MSAQPQVRPGLRTFAVCAVLFLGTGLLFVPSLGYDFSLYDDQSYVVNNVHVHAGITWDGLRWAFFRNTDYWHPLTWVSHMLDCQLYGDNAAGHHLTSVLWHAANAVLAFLVLRRLTGTYWTSAFAAALFAWHPLRVESVVWVTERKDVMSGFFFLLTLWAYAGYAERRRNARPAARCYAGTLLLFLAGVMSKPMLVGLPLLLLFVDFWPLRRTDPAAGKAATWRLLVVEKLPMVLISAIASAVTVAQQHDYGAFVLDLPLGARVTNAIVSVVRYLGKFVWPFDLIICYPHPGYWPALTAAAAAAAVLALTVLAWWQRRRRPWMLVGWAWFLLMLAPASGLVQVGFQSMADRFTYVPILGIQLAVLWTVREWVVSPFGRRLTGVLAGTLLVACGLRAADQETKWRDSVTLFGHAVAIMPRNDIAHGFLGYAYLQSGRLRDALAESQQALALNPRNEAALLTRAMAQDKLRADLDAIQSYEALLRVKPQDTKAQFALGLVLLRDGRSDEATARLKSAIARDADARDDNRRIAAALVRQGRFRDAIVHYSVALEAESNEPALHFEFGLALEHANRPADAIEQYRAALKLDSGLAPAHAQLGWALLKEKQPADAAGQFRAALRVEPKLAFALVGLGRATERLGQQTESGEAFQRAVELAPNDPAACVGWAETLARRGQFVEAGTYYERALKAEPDDASVHAALGYVRWLGGQRSQAIAAWKAALRLDPTLPGLRERLRRLGVE